MRATNVIALLSFLSASHAAAQECTTLADCTQKAMEAALQAKLALQLATPKGAVMAFNLDACPNGWSEFQDLAGRVVVGAGAGGGLSERTRGQQGGEERHTLSIEEMPSHSHAWLGSDGRESPKHTDPTPSEFGSQNQWRDTNATGGGQPHNVMQPFHVLKYCVRE